MTAETKSDFTIVSYFTNDDIYREHAARLHASASRLELESKIISVPDSGSWEHNCAIKARFIRGQWLRSDKAIVWMDADATIETAPTIFAGLKADFAVHKWQDWQFGSGTLFFGKSDAALELIDQWVLRCEADPDTWDQTHLQSAWCDVSARRSLTTYWLPRSYLQIFDAEEFEQPVIKHWQASRTARASGRMSGRPQLTVTEEGINERRDNKIWRTDEETFWINEGTAHIKPEIGEAFPEGFDVGAVLRSFISEYPVLEFGCGVGRLAQIFQPSEYVGVDVNPHAIRSARSALPDHHFRLHDHGYECPEAPTAFVYTVLLHVADAVVLNLLKIVANNRKRVVIAEIMDDRWRREGDPPVSNRTPEEYILLMQLLGFSLHTYSKHDYERYSKQPWNVGRDTRITFLVFDRTSKS